MDTPRAQQILDGFADKRVLVVGDVMLDEYVWGKVSRISPEAPVMVVDADRETYVPGGAANVVNNLCALGAAASIVGIIGEDGAGARLVEKLREEGANTDGLVSSASRPTTRKTRIIAHAQQVVRVDHERRDPVSGEAQAIILDYLKGAIADSDAVLLSDYQKGLLGRELVQAVVEQARAGGKIITGNLKPQGIGAHARLTVITLNLAEASQATGYMLEGASEATLRDAGRALLRKSGADHVLITRGAHGLTLYSADGSDVTVPAHPVEVYDVAGAGDTVISTLTLALAAGALPIEAVTLANCAGAVVVRKVGVATAAREEILATVTQDEACP